MRIISCHDFETWKRKAKQMLHQNAHPCEILWQNVAEVKSEKLLGSLNEQLHDQEQKVYKVSRTLIQLAEIVSLHKDSQKWELLYSVLWRSLHGEPFLLDGETDYQVRRLLLMRKQVRREIRKIKTLTRFKKASSPKGHHFVAWYECDHNVLKSAVPYFTRRFSSISWTLFTPYGSARWNKEYITYSEVQSEQEMNEAQLEEIWEESLLLENEKIITTFKDPILKNYFQNNTKESHALQLNEECKTAWKISEPQHSLALKTAAPNHAPQNLKASIQKCSQCTLNCAANSPVMGEGHPRPDILFVAEKPEAYKHAARRQLIQKILLQNKHSKSSFHLTYALKNETSENQNLDHMINTCRPWLSAEIKALQPKKIVCLGVKAAKAVLGREITHGEKHKSTSIFTPSFELLIVEDCFSYMSHPQFKEKFQEFSQRLESLGINACAA